ncbi:MAG: hypothetical protein M1819_000947 [Sarea resinae]|nr:MAG: hypothetical protein M1819_000947 [Sarea resinae]
MPAPSSPFPSADSQNKYEDLTGISTPTSSLPSGNPYDALISASNNDPGTLQSLYAKHRTARNALQRSKLLSPDFQGPILDPHLQRIVDPSLEPGWEDDRHCLTLWARPPQRIRSLVAAIQQKLLAVAPHLWTMPPPNLHLTALELAFSVTEAEISSLIAALSPHLDDLTNYTLTHRPRLVKPMVSFDAAALALSFVPAAGEGLSSDDPGARTDDGINGNQTDGNAGRIADDDAYTYHHLRRDLFTAVTSPPAPCKPVKINQRYVVPSAHLTIARFISSSDFSVSAADSAVDAEKVAKWVECIEGINEWLRSEYWPAEGPEEEREGGKGGEWIVGEEKGLECRRGTLWYGGGESVMIGQGS